jgi:hypothetical protein
MTPAPIFKDWGRNSYEKPQRRKNQNFRNFLKKSQKLKPYEGKLSFSKCLCVMHELSTSCVYSLVAIPPEFSNSVPIRWFCPRNYGIFIRTFRISPVFVHYVTLANWPLCTTPPLRSVPRPIGEGVSIAFWALRLSEKLFSRKLTLSNFKLSFELKKKHRKWPEHWRTSGGITVRNLVPGARPIGIPPEFAT